MSAVDSYCVDVMVNDDNTYILEINNSIINAEPHWQQLITIDKWKTQSKIYIRQLTEFINYSPN